MCPWTLVVRYNAMVLRFAKRLSDLDEDRVDATVDDSAMVFGH
jgi:hypothetical protein